MHAQFSTDVWSTLLLHQLLYYYKRYKIMKSQDISSVKYVVELVGAYHLEGRAQHSAKAKKDYTKRICVVFVFVSFLSTLLLQACKFTFLLSLLHLTRKVTHLFQCGLIQKSWQLLFMLVFYHSQPLALCVTILVWWVSYATPLTLSLLLKRSFLGFTDGSVVNKYAL